LRYSGQPAARVSPRQSVRKQGTHPVPGVALPLSCSAARYSCRMKGVGWGWAASKAFQAWASIGPGESNTRMT
jgi:hypothetical protein